LNHGFQVLDFGFLASSSAISGLCAVFGEEGVFSRRAGPSTAPIRSWAAIIPGKM